MQEVCSVQYSESQMFCCWICFTNDHCRLEWIITALEHS